MKENHKKITTKECNTYEYIKLWEKTTSSIATIIKMTNLSPRINPQNTLRKNGRWNLEVLKIRNAFGEGVAGEGVEMQVGKLVEDVVGETFSVKILPLSFCQIWEKL